MHEFESIDYERAGFGEIYDELPLWSAPFALLLLDRVPLRSDARILDVGCGTGFLSLELAQRCGPLSLVHAVDPWPEAIARLRRKCEALGIANVHVIQQDAALLELPEASIDLVVSNLGINNFAHADRVLARCATLMRPGADLLLSTNLVGHMQEFYEIFQATLVEAGRSDLLPILESHVGHRSTIDSLRRAVNAAGLEVTRVETDEFRWRFADGRALFRHFFIRLGFLPSWRELVPAEMRDEFFARLEADLDREAARRGGLTLTIPMALVEARRPGVASSRKEDPS